MMGCFIGFFGLRKRSKQGVKATDHPKQIEQVEIPGYRRAIALQGRPLSGRTKSSEATVFGFCLEDLFRVSAEVLGKGTFGTTYKANLETGKPLVLERLREFYWKEFEENEFREMVYAVEKINHENIIPFTAYYYSNVEKLLEYDYIPLGSLYALLHVNGSPLNWDTRCRITLGAARAIAYIHSQSPTTFHASIKSSNILLTTTLEARVSDYGLVQYGPIRITEPTLVVRFVDGYSAPGMTITNKLSQKTDVQKADVYRFGVLFLELLTRKDPSESYLVDERKWTFRDGWYRL